MFVPARLYREGYYRAIESLKNHSEAPISFVRDTVIRTLGKVHCTREEARQMWPDAERGDTCYISEEVYERLLIDVLTGLRGAPVTLPE